MTISATPAALFRLVSLGPITILFDEVDAIFNPLNGGNVERFPVYAPAALAVPRR